MLPYPNCKCGHPYAEHAGDRNHIESTPCWHAAGSGDGCRDTFDERCKNYEPGAAA
jgi:hypothetical protein